MVRVILFEDLVSGVVTVLEDQYFQVSGHFLRLFVFLFNWYFRFCRGAHNAKHVGEMSQAVALDEPMDFVVYTAVQLGCAKPVPQHRVGTRHTRHCRPAALPKPQIATSEGGVRSLLFSNHKHTP